MPRTPKRRARTPEPGDGSRPLSSSRHELFCLAFTGDCRRNAAESYRRAGYRDKSAKGNSASAMRLLSRPEVAARVKWLEGQALEAARLTARDAQEHLARVATATVADFLGPDGRVDASRLRDPALAQAIQKVTPVYDREGNLLDYRLELKDSMRALELLGLTETAATAGAVQQVLIIEH